MKYYTKEAMANNLKVAEQIYKEFNKALFNNEIRAYIKVNERKKKLECINVNSNIVYSHDLEYGIEIPAELMYEDSANVPVWILTQMIIIHGMLHDNKLTSNIYKNKKFKEAADKYGLIVERHKKYGYKSIGLSEKNKTLINKFCFEKTPVFYEKGVIAPKGSTIKYETLDGASIRATRKDHILYCLTNQPSDVIQKVDSFMENLGIQRMKIGV